MTSWPDAPHCCRNLCVDKQKRLSHHLAKHLAMLRGSATTPDGVRRCHRQPFGLDLGQAVPLAKCSTGSLRAGRLPLWFLSGLIMAVGVGAIHAQLGSRNFTEDDRASIEKERTLLDKRLA